MVEHQKRFLNIPVADILFFKAFGDYTEIHTKDAVFLNASGITTLSARFDPQKFIRIHRSVVVNIAHIRELYRDIGKTFLVMDNGAEFNIGRSFMPLLKHLII